MPSLFPTLDFLADHEPHSAALNMAIDEVLLQRIEVPLLRVYRWERPSISFGYFEKFTLVSSRYPTSDLVRRWTGGGIVPHGNDFTYSLLVPMNAGFARVPASDSYLAIHERIAAAMRRCGSDVVVAARSSDTISQACFENATQHDILLNGRKVAGAAQRRTKFGLLHQGSIQTMSLPCDFGQTLAAELSDSVAGKNLDGVTLIAAEALAAAKYATDAWTRKF